MRSSTAPSTGLGGIHAAELWFTLFKGKDIILKMYKTSRRNNFSKDVNKSLRLSYLAHLLVASTAL